MSNNLKPNAIQNLLFDVYLSLTMKMIDLNDKKKCFILQRIGTEKKKKASTIMGWYRSEYLFFMEDVFSK